MLTYFLCYCILGIILQAMFITVEHKKKYLPAVLLKGLASACFVELGILTSKLSLDERFAHFIVIGLMLGMGGDILLNLRFLFKKKGMIVFLVGILVFLSGHVMYLVSLLPNCQNVWLGIGIGVVLTALILAWIFSKITAKPAFKIFGVFYIGAIVIMTVIAVMNCITLQTVSSLIFVIGAFLFLASDIVLILNTFGGKEKFSLRITNLSLYYIGQLCIALSLVFA